MATPGALVQAVAAALDLPKPTIVVHDRNLVMAGLRSKKSHGRGAAIVTARDAANLIVAVMASGQVKDSAAVVERYGATIPHGASVKPYAALGIRELSRLPKPHSFLDALEALIASAASGTLAEAVMIEAGLRGVDPVLVAPSIEISLLKPGTLGEIRIAGAKEGLSASVRYALPTPWDRKRRGQPTGEELDAWEAAVRASRPKADYEQIGRIREGTILKIAAVLTNPSKEKP